MSRDNPGPTWEEATRCPKCGTPGKEGGWKPGRGRGIKVYMIHCENKLCRWYGEAPWLVQVNEDGSIPPANHLGHKQFIPVSQETETRINEALEAQLQAEKRGDGEVRNPYSR